MIPRRISFRRNLPACIALMWAVSVFGTPFAAESSAGGAEVVNAGHAGDNTADLLARLDRDVLAREPDLVVLMVGTNDMVNSRHGLTLDEYRANLATLVRRIRASGSKLVLLTMPPAYAPYVLKRHDAAFYGEGGPLARIAAGNAVIREVAREHGVAVLDLHAAFEAAGGASEHPASLFFNQANSGREDGVHPNPAGYRMMGESVANFLTRENLLGARRIVCFGDSITEGVHVAGSGTATGESYPAHLTRALREAATAAGSGG